VAFSDAVGLLPYRETMIRPTTKAAVHTRLDLTIDIGILPSIIYFHPVFISIQMFKKVKISSIFVYLRNVKVKLNISFEMG